MIIEVMYADGHHECFDSNSLTGGAVFGRANILTEFDVVWEQDENGRHLVVYEHHMEDGGQSTDEASSDADRIRGPRLKLVDSSAREHSDDALSTAQAASATAADTAPSAKPAASHKRTGSISAPFIVGFFVGFPNQRARTRKFWTSGGRRRGGRAMLRWYGTTFSKEPPAQRAMRGHLLHGRTPCGISRIGGHGGSKPRSLPRFDSILTILTTTINIMVRIWVE